MLGEIISPMGTVITLAGPLIRRYEKYCGRRYIMTGNEIVKEMTGEKEREN